ncbi:MFS transporter [Raphidocelis subcapitata]|uniref:MFS transporter n=1 Tax=Raphidocelis subcapitata TaxID=307507 RepID=A0A2V0PHP8_9CHLO|nr:MFS transporter [Raphidocelis subcapitata]|eukprot:GBF97443.1 MFS transporter [Raphidocelis subcapitata]
MVGGGGGGGGDDRDDSSEVKLLLPSHGKPRVNRSAASAPSLSLDGGGGGGGGGGNGGNGGNGGGGGPETTCMRKLNTRVLSLLFLVAMMCYIDRTNLAFASVSMTADLGFNAQVYGLGSGLFFVGYSLSMVPAQLALLRVGAPRALSAIVIAWGAAAMAFSALRGPGEFYLLRALLGVFESGAFPAMWFYINSWYPPAHITVSYSVIEAAVGAANCLAAPLAAGLLLLDGLWGIEGWRILFFAEGVPSVALGVLLWHALPRHVHDARFLTPSERAWLSAASAGARKHAEQAEALGARRMLWDAVTNPRLWLITAAGIMKNAAINGVLFFAPKLVDAVLSGSAVEIVVRPAAAAAAAAAAGGGGPRRALLAAVAAPATAGVRAAMLTAVPFVLAAAAAVWLSRRASERGDRCGHMAVPWAASSAAFLLFGAAARHSAQLGFACLSVAVVTATAPNALLNTLASSVSAGPAQAVSLSVYNAVANVGGLVGPLSIGWLVHTTGVYTVAMQGLGLLMACAACLVWWMRRWGL